MTKELVDEWLATRSNEAKNNLLIQFNGMINKEVKYFDISVKGMYDREDLLQEARLGFARAIDRYDPEKGAGLPHYASTWMKTYIQRYIQKNKSIVRVGSSKQARKAYPNIQKLEQLALQEDPSLSEMSIYYRMAELIQCDVSAIIECVMTQTYPQQIVSNSSEDNDKALTFIDPVSLDAEDRLISAIDASSLKDYIESIKNMLSDADTLILDKRLLAEKPESLESLGEQLVVSRQRIQQMEIRLISELRELLEG